MDIKNRIQEIMEYYELSPADFSDAISINRSSLTHLFSGRNKASLDLVMKIIDAFPDVNIDWLIYGNNEMLKVNNEKLKSSSENSEMLSIPDLFTNLDNNLNKATPLKIKSIETEDQEKETENDKNPLDTININSNNVIDKLYNNSIAEKASPNLQKIVFFYDNGKFEIFTP